MPFLQTMLLQLFASGGGNVIMFLCYLVSHDLLFALTFCNYVCNYVYTYIRILLMWLTVYHIYLFCEADILFLTVLNQYRGAGDRYY